MVLTSTETIRRIRDGEGDGRGYDVREAGGRLQNSRYATIITLLEVTWCMVVWCTQGLRRDGCSFMWHQPCKRCKYTTSVDI